MFRKNKFVIVLVIVLVVGDVVFICLLEKSHRKTAAGILMEEMKKVVNPLDYKKRW